MACRESVNYNQPTLKHKNNGGMAEAQYGRSENNLVSSTSLAEDEIIIVEDAYDPQSITAILNVCKKKLLSPYMRFLSLMGLRPIFGESVESRCIAKCLNFVYTLQVILFLIIGYFLQYMACFRRDKGFGNMSLIQATSKIEVKAIYNENCSGSSVSSFVIPSILHFVGYIYALVIFRRSDDDQLPVLIERVFLTSSHVPNMQINQKHIVKTLWIFVIGCFIWMLFSITLVIYMMLEGDINFKWFEHSTFTVRIAWEILLVLCTIWHDIIQASVISNYCLQVQLLKKYVQFTRAKLLQQSIRPLDWIRDLEEFRKLLNYLNDNVAPAVCFFTLINWTYALAGTIWLIASQNNITDESVPLYTTINIMNVILWWLIAAVPFIQATRLTIACDDVKTVGQEVRTRPFAHQDTPLHELNSILIYTNSLKMSAKLFNLPISGKYTGIVFAVIVLYFMVLGQSNYMPR